MSRPLVSIVIPTFNQPALLVETLASVFAQTSEDFEVIVIDDGSTNDTADVLRSCIERHGSRLGVVRQANQGVGAARNRGIEAARGKYIALLDHDDLWLPRKLQTQVEYLERHPECSAAIVPFAISTDPHRSAFDPSVLANERGHVPRPFRRIADGVPLMMTCSVLAFAKERARGLQFATERGAIEDVPFQIGLLSRGPLGIAGSDVLAIYRRHEANTAATAPYFTKGRELLRWMDARGEFGELHPADRADMLAWLASIGRVAAVRELLAGRRSRGLRIYLAELRHQVCDRSIPFLAAYPLVAISPRFLWRRVWKDG